MLLSIYANYRGQQAVQAKSGRGIPSCLETSWIDIQDLSLWEEFNYIISLYFKRGRWLNVWGFLYELRFSFNHILIE